MSNENIFNPLEKQHLGRSIVEALLEAEPLTLRKINAFKGAGIYAIYYRGDFPAYKPLASKNREAASYPIYVGKAVPQGGRKGLTDDSSLQSSALFRRLQEHRESVEATRSLNVEDFLCRQLTVDDIWIPLGESLVIQKFQPLWNQIVEGFGNHDPGKGRYRGKRPAWDELHPGRAWAGRCQPAKLTVEQILSAVAEYMRRFA